jgi:mannobiose 2-epimerase
MELSWLLLEAAEVLDEEDIIEEVLPVGLKLVDTQMSEGWTKEGAMLYERNNGEIKGGLEWWPQAESVIAFYNAWQISNDEKYLDAAIKTWKWIESHLIDKEYGEWFGGLLPDGTPDRSRPKADLWKCPYHNSRMGFELFNRTH